MEEDRDYYMCETENLLKVFRNAFSSPKQTSTCGSMSKKFHPCSWAWENNLEKKEYAFLKNVGLSYAKLPKS